MPAHPALRDAALRPVPHALGEPAGSMAEMKAYLARLRPESAAEALRLLRAAFPDAPLGARVAACGLSAG